MTETFTERRAAVEAKIAKAAAEAGRDPSAVTLIAVSKTFPAEAIAPALDAGHRVFGENRVQEAQRKWPELQAGRPDVELRLIGGLQSNKAADAVAIFGVIESLDRPKLARALADAAAAAGRSPRMLVQVNTGEEPQKSGVAPEEADAFIKTCRDEYGLPVEGLMCIPPADEASAPHFGLLRLIAERNGLEVLSMGMSADFETAVRLGATHVRLGTALFGSRDAA
ncbi:MAG: YggS family pyridoxal phosphate-dependent enzyme [Pseudomonadota bacterium]